MQRRGRLLVAVSFYFILIALFFGTQMSLVEQYPLHSVLIMYAGGLLALLNLPLFQRTGTTKLPGTLLCIELLGIHSFQAFNDLGLEDPILIWTLVIPWLAAFLIGPGYGFVFGALVILANVGFFVLEVTGYPFPHFTGEQDFWIFFVLEASSVALFLGFLGWLYEGQTLKNLRDANEDLSAMHRDLQRSKERLEQTLEGMTDGFFALDHQGRFTDLNRQAEHFLERKRGALIGTSARHYLRDLIDHEVQQYLRQAIQTGVSVEFEVFSQRRQRWFAVHAYPFAEGLSVYFNDITPRKTHEQQLIEAKEEAEHLAELKSTLLANMSHEIRTPLTSIIGFSSILEHEVSGEHLEFARLIGQNGRRLMETLNSVLDLARLEHGTLESHPEEVGIAEEINEVVDLLRPMAEQRGLDLRVAITPATLHATLDRALLNRVLTNLVGNAVKFTHEGHVAVTAHADEAHVEVQVSDTGIGISSEFLPHLFEEFRQESSGVARAYEGNGLGLAISRRLVEVMGGTIAVESEKGVGTTFTVRLPRHAVARAA